jgi:hypothetical protein
MLPAEEYLRRAGILKDHMRTKLNQKSISYQYHEAYTTVLEGVLARGDRKISRVILKAYEKGCYFDAWTEFFVPQKWDEAFEECEIDPDFYTTRERTLDEILPWDFIDVGITRSFFEREWDRAIHQQVITPNCRQQCSGCGCRALEGGVCYES